MKGCLKWGSPYLSPSHTPGIDGQAPPNTNPQDPAQDQTGHCHHHSRKCVAFGAEISEEFYPADEWDRTPTEPARKLTYQDLLELKEIQRSLPRANQPCDYISGRPSRHYLSAVPIGLLPLLPESDDSQSSSPQPSEAATRAGSQTVSPADSPRPSSPNGGHTTTNSYSYSSTSSYSSYSSSSSSPQSAPVSPWAINFHRAKPPPAHTTTTSPSSTSSFPFPPTAPQTHAAHLAPMQTSRHLAYLLPSRPPMQRQKPVFSFVPLLDVSAEAHAQEEVDPDADAGGDLDDGESSSGTATDTDADADPPTPALTHASLDSDTNSTGSRASSCEPDAGEDAYAVHGHHQYIPAHGHAYAYAPPPPPTTVSFKRTTPAATLPPAQEKDPRAMFAPSPRAYQQGHAYGQGQGYGFYRPSQTPAQVCEEECYQREERVFAPHAMFAPAAMNPARSPALDGSASAEVPGKVEEPSKAPRRRKERKRNFIVVNDMEIELEDDDDDDDDAEEEEEEADADADAPQQVASAEEKDDTALSETHVARWSSSTSSSPAAAVENTALSETQHAMSFNAYAQLPTPTPTPPPTMRSSSAASSPASSPASASTTAAATPTPKPDINVYAPVTFKRASSAGAAAGAAPRAFGAPSAARTASQS